MIDIETFKERIFKDFEKEKSAFGKSLEILEMYGISLLNIYNSYSNAINWTLMEFKNKNLSASESELMLVILHHFKSIIKRANEIPLKIVETRDERTKCLQHNVLKFSNFLGMGPSRKDREKYESVIRREKEYIEEYNDLLNELSCFNIGKDIVRIVDEERDYVLELDKMLSYNEESILFSNINSDLISLGYDVQIPDDKHNISNKKRVSKINVNLGYLEGIATEKLDAISLSFSDYPHIASAMDDDFLDIFGDICKSINCGMDYDEYKKLVDKLLNYDPLKRFNESAVDIVGTYLAFFRKALGNDYGSNLSREMYEELLKFGLGDLVLTIEENIDNSKYDEIVMKREAKDSELIEFKKY